MKINFKVDNNVSNDDELEFKFINNRVNKPLIIINNDTNDIEELKLKNNTKIETDNITLLNNIKNKKNNTITTEEDLNINNYLNIKSQITETKTNNITKKIKKEITTKSLSKNEEFLQKLGLTNFETTKGKCHKETSVEGVYKPKELIDKYIKYKFNLTKNNN